MHSDSKFIQYLEGDSKEILDLYDLIKKDDRHTNVVMLSYGPLPERLFPSWHMGYKELKPDELAFNTDISEEDLGISNDLISGK